MLCLETLNWQDQFEAKMRRDVLVSHSNESFDKGAGSAHLIAVAAPMMWKPVY